MQVTLVTTFRNEAADIAGFLDSIAAQTRAPDEIILVDGGSTDGTVERVRELLAAHPSLPARLIEFPGSNRSQARNRGIREARGDVIAMTDAGCRLRPDWLALLVAAFVSDPACEMAGGFYQADARNFGERLAALATVPVVHEIAPDTFLPSSRSVAFRKALWERVGGYPERNAFSEDTQFDLAARAAGAKMVFVPDAVVTWRIDGGAAGISRRFFRYARGDMAAGIFTPAYRRAWLQAGWWGALAFLWWRGWCIWPLAAVGVFVYWWFLGRRARRRGGRGVELLLAPLVNLWVDLAHVFGTTVGFFERRR